MRVLKVGFSIWLGQMWAEILPTAALLRVLKMEKSVIITC